MAVAGVAVTKGGVDRGQTCWDHLTRPGMAAAGTAVAERHIDSS